jgi:beta-galactosidase
VKRRDFLRRAAAGSAALALDPTGALKGGSTVAGPVRGSWVRGPTRLPLEDGWAFVRADAGAGAEAAGFDDALWERVTLPHSARVEAVVTGPPGSETYQWQGICWYRRRVSFTPEMAGRKVYLKFEGAMNVADVWLNGAHLGRHLGGYLPFGFDVSGRLQPGSGNVLAVRLDNRDDPVTGPKPLAALDFNTYHGLYRSVHLIVKDPLHITDPILAGRPGSGGVFVRYPSVSAEAAAVLVQAHVRNDGASARRFRVRYELRDGQGLIAAEAMSDPLALAAGSDTDVAQQLHVVAPALWSPRAPNLYTLHTQVLEDGRVVDEEVTRIGIRRLEMTAEGLRINGERTFLRGTNRHQEYPYVGYALGTAAQHRDARKIKEAGFDYVRLSHYAHDPAFMDACDELGLAVMNCIPGWQFYNRDDPAFAEVQYDNCRKLVRRDRNHACVFLWEVSLNESAMPAEFVARTHDIAHEEYPGDQCFTCGWTDGYDVFIQARQHGGCTAEASRPCVVSEYGDWEYYAQNAGLKQEAWADLAPDEANSRQMRWHGERRLLQQATNFQEAHNDNRKTIAFADGLWVMFDYNRGYAPDIESSGCMDLFRIPKLSHAFFRSQRDASERPSGGGGPMVFVATWWTPDSPTAVRVFGNCDEVELFLNGRSIARQRPDRDRTSTHLAHPPFTFDVGRFEPGSLEAVGYLAGRPAARHVARTPGRPARLEVQLDEAGRRFGADGKDVAFVRAALVDARGTVVPDAWENVHFGATGDLELVGTNPFSSEAGIASILVQTGGAARRGAVYALALVREDAGPRVLTGAASAGGTVEPWDTRLGSDGARAELLVGGRVLVATDPATPRFRIPGSTAPRPAPGGDRDGT